MANVIIHATITLDGFMADKDGGVDWMFDFEAADEDYAVVNKVMGEIGAIVGGANKMNTIEEGEIPYGGMLKVPIYLMTHEKHEPIEKDGITYRFIVDDIKHAVETAKASAGDKSVALLGGRISRQCLRLGLVDEIVLAIVPILLGDGVSLFGELGERIKLERTETSAFASETHLRFRVVK
ncbi:dihydrofolate reductase family protein [Jeotgalibacillus proteolyticus]|uniref:Deaminase n=1 Tax=Jeotgalibacillus proteolyticus TaxID=2082395 RepID=A0A2S5GDB4_9BACL|nr:dihydrofolate reductase family protein [Jeotgalibacillus proteolyticus]PPA71027.1 deaminase [Jeotgalibacillus proteolyticus]